jgi:multidrug efflux pump subunit AcrA (membrane-fusion protein)
MRTKLSFNYSQAITAAIWSDKKYPEQKLFKLNASACFKGSVVFLLSMLLILVLSVGVNAESPGPEAGPPPLVTVSIVVEQDVNPPSEYVGHVEAIQSVNLRARVEGFLEHVNFKEGSDVHAGDLLYVIEQAPYQAKVDADKASLAQVEAILTKARQYLHRAQTVRSGGVSATDLDNAVSEELRAKAGKGQSADRTNQSGLHLD